ncbi:MAG: beta-ketoacyl-ACP synthase I [Candidatus Accumulibacter sp.]|nr:beta-ketoacyl-ACP synthase I [Accumulibacter sp.]
MRRVAVTGMGIVSCLGNDLVDVEDALRRGRVGVRYVDEYEKLGFKSRVAGVPDVSGEPVPDRKLRRFMGDVALFAYHAARRAISDAALDPRAISDPRTGLIVGSGVGSLFEHHAAATSLSARGAAKLPPYFVPRVMGSTASACLSTAFGIEGISYSISAACATGAHCIGHGADLIRCGRQDRMLVGGAEEVQWTSTALFDAMGALSTAYNDETASRPFDAGRDGFVIAGGAGVLVLEELELARRRGARIYAELAAYGANCDGRDMTATTPESAARAMRLALDGLGDRSVDYINAHATSTRLGDIAELTAIREVFGDAMPPISSTKGLAGHPIAAAGAHDAIYSLLMLERGFLTGCANLFEIAPECAAYPLLARSVDCRVDTVMSNSFGFGGTNASLIFRRVADG